MICNLKFEMLNLSYYIRCEINKVFEVPHREVNQETEPTKKQIIFHTVSDSFNLIRSNVALLIVLVKYVHAYI